MTERVNPPFSEAELRIMNYRLRYPGKTVSETAEALGISRQWVSTLVNREPLYSALTAIMQEIAEEAKEQALYGMAESVSLLRSIVGDTVKGTNGKAIEAPLELRARCAMRLVDLFQRRPEGQGIGEDDWEFHVTPTGGIRGEPIKKRIPAAGTGGDNGDEFEFHDSN